MEVEERALRVLDNIADDHQLLTRFDMRRRIMGKYGTKASFLVMARRGGPS